MNSKNIFFVFVIFVACFALTCNCIPFYFDDVFYEPHQLETMKIKRAINPFMDSIGKRNEYNSIQPRRYFDVLAGQSLGKRSNYYSR